MKNNSNHMIWTAVQDCVKFSKTCVWCEAMQQHTLRTPYAISMLVIIHKEAGSDIRDPQCIVVDDMEGTQNDHLMQYTVYVRVGCKVFFLISKSVYVIHCEKKMYNLMLNF